LDQKDDFLIRILTALMNLESGGSAAQRQEL